MQISALSSLIGKYSSVLPFYKNDEKTLEQIK